MAVYYVRTKKYPEAKTRLNYILTVYPDSTIAPLAKDLLEAIESGHPPRWGFSRWLPDLSLPDWNLFTGKERDEQDAALPAQ